MFEDFVKNLFLKKKLKICVIGDAMIDQYYNVSVKKISPEFPIPVMCSEYDTATELPGGAANVAYQFKNFNVDVKLCSFLDWLAGELLFRSGVNTQLCEMTEAKVPRKKRFYSDGFPTYRWDVEQKNYGFMPKDLEANQNILYDRIMSEIQNFDVVIFSDYDKGVFSDKITNLVRTAKISIVDPKNKNIEKWKHCTIFKPNKKEALELTGCDNIQSAGEKLLSQLECEAVVITEANEGVSIFDKSGSYKIRPSSVLPKAKSVIGAGDCFIAFLAMAMSQGFQIKPAVELAWNAGLIYVQNSLNKPISISDLEAGKSQPEDKILTDIDFLLDRQFDLVFTNGCFDILHTGHLSLLNFAKKQGSKLIVAVNSDESIGRLKPGRPFINLYDRMTVLANLSCVDYVVSFTDDTPLKLIKKLRPEVLVKGDEYKVKDIVGADFAEKVVVAPMVRDRSTTTIVNKIVFS